MKPDRIVFVDDDSFYAFPWIEKLQTAYDVTHFTEATQALNHCRYAHDAKCMIVDVMMPAPDGVPSGETARGFETGLWLLEKLSQHIAEGPVPVVVMTNRELGLIKERLDRLQVPNGLVVLRHKLDMNRNKLLGLVKELISKWPRQS